MTSAVELTSHALFKYNILENAAHGSSRTRLDYHMSL
jgi:hypothetical protein